MFNKVSEGLFLFISEIKNYSFPIPKSKSSNLTFSLIWPSSSKLISILLIDLRYPTFSKKSSYILLIILIFYNFFIVKGFDKFLSAFVSTSFSNSYPKNFYFTILLTTYAP